MAPYDEIDELDDLLLPEDDKTPEDQFDGEEVKSLRDKIAELEKENKGLLKATQAERQKRQQIKGRLDQVTTTVNSILEQRQQAAEQFQTQQEKSASAFDGIPVEFTEDGDAYIPSERLKEITAPYEDEINNLKNELDSTRTSVSADRQYQQTIQSLVGEKPEYSDAFRKYQAARKWVNDAVIDWSSQNNVTRALNSGEALDHVFDEDLTNEFNKRFPDVDLASVVTAEDSTWHFKQMLSKLSEAADALKEAPRDGRFQRVLHKPSSLGKSANAKGGELGLVEKVGSLSATDIMSLGDEQIAALEKFMLSDEQNDGIKF